MTTVVAATVGRSIALDPEEEAYKALKTAICAICRKQDITSKTDERLIRIVDKYNDHYPNLTAEVIEAEVRAQMSSSPINTLEIDDCKGDSTAFSALTRSVCGSEHGGSRTSGRISLGKVGLNESMEMDGINGILMHSLYQEEEYPEVNSREAGEEGDEDKDKEEEKPCCFSFRKQCEVNQGYNLLTYTFLLSFIVLLAFICSGLITYLNYNRGAYRDWALAGGVTSTSANFRVRGPSNDDGKRREFVVSTNANLAFEKDQIMNVAVSFRDFVEEEHFVKRLQLDTLSPLTTYHYGITRPQRISNSAVVAGDVGSFTTPAPEGERMDFTIATGSCALTGSDSSMFRNILDLDPLMFIHMGDFHYEDLNTLNIDDRLEAYDKVMGSASQRLLYMRTIFSYIWDDHDWLGNNQDSDYEEAAAVAKQSYTLGIPHYELGSTSTDEANAAKYQAFTIGTVRFIITDLRSESIKSSEYYQGKVYSKEQKQWLYREFARAENYDFVVWVTTRPWTDEAKIGSDSWGGFVPDRDELSSFIANTIGAGPKNLIVLSGDNHMVAYDDGSSTDYSDQDEHPGGFPLLHSGPMTNYGSGLLDFFVPQTNYFTDGCMATNSELNYQFSTLEFAFPTNDNRAGCVRIRSYSEDSSNVILEKKICGETMRYGTEEQDTCTLKKLTVPTYSLFISAAGLILLQGISALWYLGLNRGNLAMSYFGMGCLYYLLTIGAAIAGAFCFGTLGVNMLAVSGFVLGQTVLGSFFVGKAVFGYCSNDTDNRLENGSPEDDDKAENAKALEKDEDGASTFGDTFEDSPLPHGTFGGEVISKADARENIDSSSPETVEAEIKSHASVSIENESKADTAFSSASDVIEKEREKSEAREADDCSLSAILRSDETPLSTIEEKPSSVSVASLLESVKSVLIGSPSPVSPKKNRSLDAGEIIHDLQVKGEGIEITNPTSKLSSAHAIKVSPSLISI